MSDWPGEERRRPSRGERSWSMLAPLSLWLEEAGRAAAEQRVLDVGCGVKPYLPFFADRA